MIQLVNQLRRWNEFILLRIIRRLFHRHRTTSFERCDFLLLYQNQVGLRRFRGRSFEVASGNWAREEVHRTKKFHAQTFAYRSLPSSGAVWLRIESDLFWFSAGTAFGVGRSDSFVEVTSSASSLTMIPLASRTHASTIAAQIEVNTIFF